jgi:sulfide:quinone oxidoreductase
VDARKRVVHTAAEIQYPYDALILALGARPRARYAHALTLDDARLDELMHAVIQDVEAGHVGRLAFVIPGRMAWPLPIYELALMTAARAYEMSIELQSTIVTPEDAPLAIFGSGASDGISQLLEERSITTVTSADCEIPESGRIVIAPGDRRLEVDRIVALPELYGPAVPGVPNAHHGFIPVDPHCKVRGVERVYAAGDGTDFAIKHGGIASQQADAAAQAIAALAGVQIRPEPFRPLIRGMLLTGSKPKYLSAHLTGGHSFNSKITDEPMWSPPTKIAARYLAPYLEIRGSDAQRG